MNVVAASVPSPLGGEHWSPVAREARKRTLGNAARFPGYFDSPNALLQRERAFDRGAWE